MDTSWPPASAPRNHQLKVRLTEDEKRLLGRRAALRGLSVSEFVRMALSPETDTPPEATSGAPKTDSSGPDASDYTTN
jgi:hypothetical protein